MFPLGSLCPILLIIMLLCLETCCCNFRQYSFSAKNGGWNLCTWIEINVFVPLMYSMDTNPEEWRITLSIVAHCKVVRLWPQNLHNVLVELCLFFLQRENLTVSSQCSLISWWQRQSTEPLRVIEAEEKRHTKGNACHLYNHINSPLGGRATAAVVKRERERERSLNCWKKV